MKKHLLKTILLLFALVAGTSMSWADDTIDNAATSSQLGKTATSSWVKAFNLTGASGAVYKIRSMGTKSTSNALQWNANGYLYASTSGGTLESVTITGTSGKTVDIFASNNAYSAKATGDAVKTMSLTGSAVTYTFTSNYAYIAINGKASSTQITSIVIKYKAASSDETTTTIIDASGITNTDVYVGTAAGTLAATVKDESSNTVAGAAVTWSGNNNAVATINPSTGAVTLVSAGVVTFTANYDGEDGSYAPSYGTYEMTVTSSEPYVQPTKIEITPNYTFWGKAGQFSGDTYSNLSGSQDNVSLAWARGGGSTYANKNAMRFYKDNTLTFTAPTGYEIKSIKLDVSDTYKDLTFSPSGFDTNSKTWTGAATTVTMSRPSDDSNYSTISKYTITIGLPSSVDTPTFTVTADPYSEAKNVKVSNYNEDYIYFYTIDGTDPDCDELTPTGTSQVYDHATGIDVTATTTLKMIAVDIDGNKSNVASATYTLPLATIAEVKEQANNSAVRVKLTDAQVVFVSGNDIYVRDATGAMDFYQSGISELKTGDIFDATIEATYTLYKGMPELMTFTSKSITKKGNSTVIAKVITTAEQAAANVCDLVKFEGVQLTQESKNYYIGTTGVQLYNKFSASYATETSKDVDVSGIIVPFGNSEPYTYEICPRFDTDVVYLDNSEEVAIGEAGVATFCSANALDFTAVDAIKVYIAKAEVDKVTLTEIQKVPANTGVILMNALGMSEGAVAAINVPYLETTADNVTENELVGITTPTVVDATVDGKYNYILSNEDAGVGFYKAVNGVQLAANKAYLSTTVNAAVRGFLGFTEDDSDAIIEIAKNEKMSAIYDLSGRRVVKPTKGLYIVNGKKVVK